MTTPLVPPTGRRARLSRGGVLVFVLVLAGAAALAVRLGRRGTSPVATSGHDHSAMVAGGDSLRQVRLSPAGARRIGVTFAEVTRSTLGQPVRAVAEVTYDQTKVATVTLKVEPAQPGGDKLVGPHPRFLWHQMMAQKGYIMFSVDNRGSSGRGHKFESAVYRKFGAQELADQLAGVAYLKSLSYVDGARIGIWGWSFGGYMTCYAMTNAPEVFKAGFAGAPVTDWRQYDSIYTKRYMKLPQENAEGYQNSSPVHQTGQLKGKLLIAHGTGDDNVHFANTIHLTEEFIKAGKYAETMFYPARGHGISDTAAQIHMYRRVMQFFLDNLKTDHGILRNQRDRPEGPSLRWTRPTRRWPEARPLTSGRGLCTSKPTRHLFQLAP